MRCSQRLLAVVFTAAGTLHFLRPKMYEEIVPDYLEMLACGGSRSPEALGRIVGVDLADPAFWDRGLDLVAEQLDAAEAAAEQVLAAG